MFHAIYHQLKKRKLLKRYEVYNLKLGGADMDAKQNRRKFLKTAALFTAAVTVGSISVVKAKEAKAEQPPYDNGVVRGHSPKREILYHMTKHWEDYYRVAP